MGGGDPAIVFIPCVGIPGLGYPLLLRLDKSLVVILDYVQQPEPCGPEPRSPNSGPGPSPG